MNAPTEQAKLTKIEEAALGGGGSLTGAGVGFVVTVPGVGDGDFCWVGTGVPTLPTGGDGNTDDSGESPKGEGKAVVVWFVLQFLLLLSASTFTNTF